MGRREDSQQKSETCPITVLEKWLGTISTIEEAACAYDYVAFEWEDKEATLSFPHEYLPQEC